MISDDRAAEIAASVLPHRIELVAIRNFWDVALAEPDQERLEMMQEAKLIEDVVTSLHLLERLSCGLK